MKRMLALLAIACLTFSVVFAAGAQETGDQSLKKVLDKGKFVLGLDDSFPPMGYRNEKNEIVGFDVDLAKEVTKRLGVELVLQPIDWNAKEQELNTGKIDCIWNGFTITEERKKNLNFSDPYLNVSGRGQNSNTYKTLKIWLGRSRNQAGLALPMQCTVHDFAKSLKEVVEVKDSLTA